MRLIVVAGHHRQVSEIRRLSSAECPHDAAESQHSGEDLRRDAEFVCELGDEVPLAPSHFLHDGTDARSPARSNQSVPGAQNTGGHLPLIVHTAL